jgi:hypothetical protein
VIHSPKVSPYPGGSKLREPPKELNLKAIVEMSQHPKDVPFGKVAA